MCDKNIKMVKPPVVFSNENLLELNDDCIKLKHWIETRKFFPDININIESCDPEFWINKKDKNNQKYNKSLDINEKNIIVNISFVLSNIRAEEIAMTILPVTLNENNKSITTWNIKRRNKKISYPCGVYAKSGFYKAYKALLCLKPNITHEQFARNSDDSWDTDLVSLKIYSGYKRCIKVIEKKDEIETGESIVILSLLMCDIRKNLDYIQTILTTFVIF